MRRGITITLAAILLLAAGIDARAEFPFHFDGYDPRIANIEVTGNTTVRDEAVLDVIPVKTGDIYSPELVDRAREYLEKWGLFDDIDIDVSKSRSGVVLTISLSDATIVAQIDIAGNYPYIENKVRKYLTLHAGDVYTPAKVEEQIQRLSDFYAREGYVDTEVSVSEEEGPAPKTILLTFHIHRGRLLRYRNVVIEGNRAYPDGRFVSAINTYQPYSEKRLRRSLRKLRRFYHMHGYPRAKIRVTRKIIDLEADRVDLTLGVKEGPYIDARFVGNDRVSVATLKKTITIFREASFDSYEIEESVKAIVEYYRKHGFPDVKVDAHRTKISDDYIIITFEIDEGRSKYIRTLNFEGNEAVSDKTLTKDMRTKKHALGRPGALLEKNIPHDSEVIADALKRKGYLDARVEDWEIESTAQGYAYNVTIPIEEGQQTIVESISFSGNYTITGKELLKVLKLKTDKPFNPFIVEEDRQRVKLYYADHGHPYAEVVQDVTINDGRDSVRIDYAVDEGPEVKIGYILIVGDVLTSQKAIKNAISLKSGDQFSYKKLVDSQLNIRRLGAFSSVKVETIGIEDKQTTVHLKVSVDEERPFRIDLEMGYSTADSFIGSLLFTNINSFGWAKKTFLKLTAGRKLSRAELGWRDPRFLSSSFEMSVITWIQHRIRPSYNYVQLGGSLGFYRRFERLGVLFLQEFTRNYFVEGDSVAADADSLRNNNISRTSMSASYDARDSFSNPTRGYYGLGKIDFFNEIGGNRAHFVKFSLQVEYDYSPLKRLVFSSAGRFDDIETIGSNISVPTNELLFMGGADTVRGYAEDSLGPMDAQGRATGGRVRWIINEELRLRLLKSFQLAGFFDCGSLTNNFGSIGTGTVRMSAGVGVRYLTPVGPLRLDIGFPINPRANDSNHRVHFTFGYVF
jgi:outer membrane protein insertion porin family